MMFFVTRTTCKFKNSEKTRIKENERRKNPWLQPEMYFRLGYANNESILQTYGTNDHQIGKD